MSKAAVVALKETLITVEGAKIIGDLYFLANRCNWIFPDNWFSVDTTSSS